ncbi:MAG: hypothetical protein M0042_04055 [Nitrospiraceae bacterium]|nr:hypothetical protein [Nitrospiraceae bacterium]
MRQRVLTGVFALFLLWALPAQAKPVETLTQNHFTTAESLDAGMTQVGAHFTAGEGYQSYYPAFRFGMGMLFEAGLRAGATTADTGPEDKVATLIGGDIKYQLVKQTEGVPVDMALRLGFDNHFINSKNVSELSFATIFSRSFPLTDRGYKLTPYGGLELSALYGSYLTEKETDYYLFAGLEWRFLQRSMMYLELKAGEHAAGGLGIRFEY